MRHVNSLVVLLILVSSMTSAIISKEPPQCSVYCSGLILSTIQQAMIFNDSKTFVDMPMKYDPQEVLCAFQKLPNNTRPVLLQFLQDYFLPAGSELLEWTPSDWNPEPAFLSNLKNPMQYKTFGKDLNQMWTSLGKQLIPDVGLHPQRYSIIPLKNPFIVPGERFHEFYYWDSYWIIKGLLVCGMNSTAKGIIMNTLGLISQFGFVPNGARVYYLTRSQPPLLSEMIYEYYKVTKDKDLLVQALPLLALEYGRWMDGPHAVQMDANHTLNRYYSDVTAPRPESFREDFGHTSGMSEDQARIFYRNTIAAAESGQDFSTRWFSSGIDILSIVTDTIVPVDLNSFLYKFESNMKYYYEQVGKTPDRDYHAAMVQRKEAMDRYLWNGTDFQWYDYNLNNKTQIIRAYPSNWFPLYSGAYDHISPELANNILESLKNSQLVQKGGVLTTLIVDAHQQWDYPNSWAPLVSLLVSSLIRLNTTTSLPYAQSIALDWLNSNLIGYNKDHQMHEKYNAFVPGQAGTGGEYPPQVGFGWTNGVALEFMSIYG